MKNTELVRNFAIGGICILAASLVFLGAESGGRALGSRLGMIGLVGIVALLAVAFISARKIEAEKAEKPSSAKKRS
jgi:hypothetical protein